MKFRDGDVIRVFAPEGELADAQFTYDPTPKSKVKQVNSLMGEVDLPVELHGVPVHVGESITIAVIRNGTMQYVESFLRIAHRHGGTFWRNMGRMGQNFIGQNALKQLPKDLKKLRVKMQESELQRIKETRLRALKEEERHQRVLDHRLLEEEKKVEMKRIAKEKEDQLAKQRIKEMKAIAQKRATWNF